MAQSLTRIWVEGVPMSSHQARAGSLASLLHNGNEIPKGKYAGLMCKGGTGTKPCKTRLNMYNNTGYCGCCQPDR